MDPSRHSSQLKSTTASPRQYWKPKLEWSFEDWTITSRP